MSASHKHATNLERGTLLEGGLYLTVSQAAAELGVSTAAVKDAIRRGRIISIKIGHIRLVHGDEVALYRDTRKPSRGHPAVELDEGRKAEVERLVTGRKKKPAVGLVYYRHVGGGMVRISKLMAQVLERLDKYVTPPERAQVVHVLHQQQVGIPTAGQAIKLLDRLEAAHLIYRIRGRDRHGVDVTTLRVGLAGQDALAYCRKRGLI